MQDMMICFYRRVMIMNRRISEKDLKLIISLFAILILVGSYQFGYRKFTARAEELYSENEELDAKFDELSSLQGSKGDYLSQIDEMQGNIKAILDKYPAALTQEKIMMFLLELEEYADMDINNISFQDVNQFYSTTNSSENSEVSIQNDQDNINTLNQEETSEDDIKYEDLVITGYQTAIVINYRTNYKGLKKAIDYINKNEDKMNINDLSASFDNTTGNLTGSMTINLFSIMGTDKVYEEPKINGGRIGTDNIFGTVEAPVIED